MAGVRAALTAQAQNAILNPDHAPLHTTTVEFCHAYPDFTPMHMRTAGCESAVAIPRPSVTTLLLVVTELFNKAADVRGKALRDAAWDTLFMFPTLVLGPQNPGASSSSIKSKIATRMDLWNKGHLDVFTTRAKANIRPPSSNKQNASSNKTSSAGPQEKSVR
jgi:hypothetical protein